jgi:hypothetical protein
VKTTVHLVRPARPAPPPARRATVRLGLVLSALAVLALVVLRLLTDVSAMFVLIPVVIVGFALSWHADSLRRR